MKLALIVTGLVLAYLIGQLLFLWSSRNARPPPPPPEGWRTPEQMDEDDEAWKDDAGPRPPR